MKYRAPKTLSQQEQQIVEKYLNRELYRPNTTITKAIAYILLMLIISEIITAIFCLATDILVISFKPSVHISFFGNMSFTDFLSVNFRVLLFIFIITLRITLIGLVHLYQHYAPEQMRRRCLCKPSCSEYMILAIKKYGPIIGTIKGIKRLISTCDGLVYKIDYP